jgi:hypothetical protein
MREVDDFLVCHRYRRPARGRACGPYSAPDTYIARVCRSTLLYTTPMEKQPLIRSQGKPRTSKPVLVIHGGAGVLDKSKIPPPAREQYRERLSAALLAGHKVLQAGGEAMDAVVAAVSIMEGS